MKDETVQGAKPKKDEEEEKIVKPVSKAA